MTFSLSRIVISHAGDPLYTFDRAASMAETSVVVVESCVELGIIEASGSMLHSREIGRIAQIQRLRQDLGLNLVGAAMVLDMTQEIAHLRARLNVYLKCPSASDGKI